MTRQDRRFAQQIAEIASIELSLPLGACRCLVLGEGERAQAVLEELEGRAREVDGAAQETARYDLVVLMGEEEAPLGDLAADGALLIDAAEKRGRLILYNAQASFRRIRVAAIPSC